MADHYATLGVALEADRTAIQAAYRRLARLHHPDFGGDPAVMTALNEAWSILGHPQTRAVYDATRRVGSGVRMDSSPGSAVATPPPRPAGPIAAAAERRTGAPRDERASTVNFGRYTGWTIAQLAVHDPDYLEWLARAPIGRTYRQEIYLQLARRPAPRTTYTNGGTATMERPSALRARLGLRRR